MEANFLGLYHSLVQATVQIWYFMWQARNCCTIYRPPQGSDAPEHLDGIQEFCTMALQTGHTPTSKNPYSFAEYQALLITTAETYDAEWTAR